MLKKAITNIVKKYHGIFGIYVQCDDGTEVKINTSEVFQSASLIKLFILLAIQDEDLDNMVEIKDSDRVGGGGVLDKLHLSSLSVRDLAMLMITLSDNMATNILINYLGMDRVNETIKKYGFKKTILQRKMLDIKAMERNMDNYTTPEDVMNVLKILYEKPIFLNMLLEQQLNCKLSLYISENENYKFAHKTGELTNVEHDAGRLYYKNRTIDVVVMTKGLKDNMDGIKLQNEIGELLQKIITE